VLTDLALSPHGADVRDMVAAAQAADAGGFDTVWTYDHFSGLIAGAAWSRDPFVTLGAIAASTDRIKVGVLVANVVNRHPAQLACAINSLQSLAPGRVAFGIGSGSARGGRFASEHYAIGRPLAASAQRRELLIESIDAVRALFRGEAFSGEQVEVAGAMAVIDGALLPPIIVGASGRETIQVACEHADGVNLLPGADLAGRVEFARSHAVRDPFEVSAFTALDVDHPLGGDPDALAELGIERRTLYVAAPFPIDVLATIGGNLNIK
jgi:alkanesulfonate monooxygenase SsuD/methylene tetrahydromethanopterin reductase-like flavin-dependent oxidoreductase (luciferase family)